MASPPALVVFGLDYTLWSFHVHFANPPFSADKTNVIGREREVFSYYPEIPKVLSKLQRQGIKVAVITKAQYEQKVTQLLSLFKLDKYISVVEVCQGDETEDYQRAFQRIKEKTKVEFVDMLQYNAYDHYIRVMNWMGVYGIPVRHGVTEEILDTGIKRYQTYKARPKAA